MKFDYQEMIKNLFFKEKELEGFESFIEGNCILYFKWPFKFMADLILVLKTVFFSVTYFGEKIFIILRTEG